MRMITQKTATKIKVKSWKNITLYYKFFFLIRTRAKQNQTKRMTTTKINGAK